MVKRLLPYDLPRPVDHLQSKADRWSDDLPLPYEPRPQLSTVDCLPVVVGCTGIDNQVKVPGVITNNPNIQDIKEI